MFTRRSIFTLVAALGLLVYTGCSTANTSLQVQVIATDTQLGVANATITIQHRGNSLPGQTTDASGNATFTANDNGSSLTTGDYVVTVAAAGYETFTHTYSINFSTAQVQDITISLNRSAPALVFYTYTGSTTSPTPQAATVTVFTQDGSQVFSGNTFAITNSQYAVVTVPDLLPSTQYTYTITATGFQNVTQSQITNSDNTVASVYVPLSPPTVNVEFQTAFLGITEAGQTGTSATITFGNYSVTTEPLSPAQSYDSGTITGLQPGTTYTYSVFFSQFNITLTNQQFTTPSSSPVTGSYVVPILYDPSAPPPAKNLPS